MIINYHENFLEDRESYRLSEQFWNDLWQDVLRTTQSKEEWSTPWVGTGSSDIKDGNPIFSAISTAMKRGVRVIQEEPIDEGLDFQFWLDDTGDSLSDPNNISELVIACVLSDVAAYQARLLLTDWILGNPLSINLREGRLVYESSSTNRGESHWDYSFAA